MTCTNGGVLSKFFLISSRVDGGSLGQFSRSPLTLGTSNSSNPALQLAGTSYSESSYCFRICWFQQANQTLRLEAASDLVLNNGGVGIPKAVSKAGHWFILADGEDSFADPVDDDLHGCSRSTSRDNLPLQSLPTLRFACVYYPQVR